jgi:hypothetical protein
MAWVTPPPPNDQMRGGAKTTFRLLEMFRSSSNGQIGVASMAVEDSTMICSYKGTQSYEMVQPPSSQLEGGGLATVHPPFSQEGSRL